MSFDRTNFGLKDASMNSGSPRHWTYTTVDLATDVDTAGYFNDAADLVKVGDIIYANVDTDGTPGYGSFFVSANNGTVVDVNNMATVLTTSTVTGGTDSD